MAPGSTVLVVVRSRFQGMTARSRRHTIKLYYGTTVVLAYPAVYKSYLPGRKDKNDKEILVTNADNRTHYFYQNEQMNEFTAAPTDISSNDNSFSTRKRQSESADEITLPSKKCFKVDEGLATEKTTGASSSAEDEPRRIAGDTEKSNAIEIESCFDVCQSLKIDRLEVLWCIAPDDEAVEEKVLTPDLIGAHTTEKRWWGATLLPLQAPSRYYTFSDEEDDSESSYVTVPIRHLLYDAYVEGGFPETSLNEVAFIS